MTIADLSHVVPEIRPFFDRDLDQMRKIEKRAYVDYPWASHDWVLFLRRIADDHEAYIAEWREHILGFMLVVRSEWSYEIVSIAITPEFSRIGVGTQLVDYLKAKLIPYGREDIYTLVHKTNSKALEFFNEQGFVVIDIIDNEAEEACYKMKYEVVSLPLKEEFKHL